ncbi:hypothetical protein [Clostridium sp. UBA5119]|uniref:hypothetical protein n=1 Tax=Clostridium sp. UBA5119 TaxID=1946366 RepID=UPI003216E99D
MLKVEELLNFDLDPIPRYLLMRDVLKLDSKNKELISAKSMVIQSKWVKNIIQLQWNDGSWGQFHSMSQSSQSSITTEQALRRLLILGLDKNDEVIQRAIIYMEKYLNGELTLRDREEKKHNWSMLTRLFVATWILIFDSTNDLAKGIAKDWSRIITHAFLEDEYNHNAYKEAYYDIHKSSKEKYLWGFENFYVVSILNGMLSSPIESKFLDYIMESQNGIYYIYDRCSKIPPSSFYSKIASRYINVHELLSNYTGAKPKLQYFVEWVNDNISEDGFWDMGQLVKDNIQFPLSNSWRDHVNRKIDCTVRIQKILSRLDK